MSIGIMIALVVIKTLSEKSAKVEELEEKTYKLLLHKIVAAGTTSQPEVLVIDIGDIKPKRSERDGELMTPREPLEQLLRSLANRGPRSLGIDVDFSPEKGEFIDAGDPGFFKRCLALADETRIPIFLGVSRTLSQPNRWLDDYAHDRLAAAIAIRRIVDHDQMPHWIRVQEGARLRSMSAALAGVDVNAEETDNSPWAWARKSTSSIKLPSGIESKETTIDYASLPWIKAEVLPVFSSDAFAKLDDKIRGRMVILGDKEPSERDRFDTPAGRLPGVYLHACAANTIATEPLYRLTVLGRLAIDLILAVTIFLFVRITLWVRSFFRHATGRAEGALNLIFTLAAILFVFLVSVVFVNRTRLLWTDFVLVCVVLAVQLVIDFFRSRRELRARKIV